MLRASLKSAVERLPRVEGTGGEVNVSRGSSQPAQLTDREAQKRDDQFIASELFLLVAATGQTGESGGLCSRPGSIVRR